MLIESEPDMAALAARFSKKLQANNVVYLSGDLGAGKTSFARGLLHAMGFVGTVKSPTYTMVEEYHVKDAPIFHWDLYRLKDMMELEDMGWRDYFQPDSINLIEWPEHAQGILPPADWQILIAADPAISDDARYVTIFQRDVEVDV